MTGIWIENPTAYQQKLERLLGDRDPLEVLAETPVDLERTGLHNERGPESLGLMQRMHAGHDLAHLDQLDRYLQD